MELLRNELYPFLKANLSVAQIEGRAHGNRRPLTVDEKVGIGLMTAGGCPIGGILAGFHVGKTCALKTITDFFFATIQSGVGEIKFPSTLAELQATADTWHDQRAFCKLYHGHIGALDGLAVRIPIPKTSESDNPLGYLTRKGFAAVNAQVIVDGHDKCILCSVETMGPTHDSSAWEFTSLSKQWKSHPVVDPRTHRVFWISLDDAYAATRNTCPPWPGTGLIMRFPYRDAFNYYLSGGCRSGIERLFGQMYERWGLLWRPIRFSSEKGPIFRLCLVSAAQLFKRHWRNLFAERQHWFGSQKSW